MPDKSKWKSTLNEYIKQNDPGRVEKANAWKVAIGLQDVDGLKTSEYLLDTARDNIEGKIDFDSANARISRYYEEKEERNELAEEKEADIVSARIAQLLSNKTFTFSPASLQKIHEHLFKGIVSKAGKFRTYNITKKEWVLNEDTVIYSDYRDIVQTLNYDFDQEKSFKYTGLDKKEFIEHISKFTSGIWQIHPFPEGNTRTVAVFIIKYLKTFGIDINNAPFEENSWYFRNALVRANYNNFDKNVYETTEFLERFFSNIIVGSDYELRKRYLHVDYVQSANPKCSDCTLKEKKLLELVNKNKKITQKELSEKLGVSLRTVKNMTASLQSRGYLTRINGKRYGEWVVNVNLQDKSITHHLEPDGF